MEKQNRDKCRFNLKRLNASLEKKYQRFLKINQNEKK